jgi:L-cysteine S-thiosulfotransferase
MATCIITLRTGSRRRTEAALAVCALVVCAFLDLATSAPAQGANAAPSDLLTAYRVLGDAIAQPLTDVPGDATRGRAIVANRQTGLCLLCHSAPIGEEKFQGEIGPDLRGAGARWSAAQLRLRVVNGRLLNPQSVMPAYYRVDGLTRVASQWRGQPVLNAQQIEDVVVYLGTLRD